MTTGSVTETCGSCRYWLAGRAPLVGSCKRYPPTALMGGQALPGTVADDWCGEFEQRAEETAKPVGFAPPPPPAADPKAEQEWKRRKRTQNPAG